MSCLDGYNLMICSKYFTSITDFKTVQMVCKKFRQTTMKFHYNPIPLTHKTHSIYFSKIETLVLYSPEDDILDDLTFFARKYLYQVTYDKVATLKGNNIFCNVLYTISDRSKYGDVPSNMVTEIDKQVYTNSELTSLKLPNVLTAIGDYAFSGSTQLKELDIPPCVVTIGKYCFFNCFAIEEVVIPKGIKTLFEYTFHQCKLLKKITLNEGICTIGRGCFSYCESLNNVKIPESVTEIDHMAFASCYLLENVELNENKIKFGFSVNILLLSKTFSLGIKIFFVSVCFINYIKSYNFIINLPFKKQLIFKIHRTTDKHYRTNTFVIN
ncbi:hypothetical protein EIN_200750 [Entamoeba invadens IP1]|uniref:Leucine rich repeat containing protein BspA family protein n=1 Tax=Entamoeba invadens IP1 TaxID=370355 RepID=L7FL80_ENTIV|nr:hypothetical protein EIN_200750 [Entamoeba invadens IP1]ELP83637.1 hypothetical protein EIN_200750 [Entamoeba invadens IP1]|eukprot:XP_004182983.1 hypothetical protein EIN_200750 [Entamoeba invadens IP1]